MALNQSTCAHVMQPVIFMCQVPVQHQDQYCIKCRKHVCTYAALITQRKRDERPLAMPIGGFKNGFQPSLVSA